MTSFIQLICLFFCAQLIFSCCKTEQSDCPTDLACTEIFASVGVKIQNSKNEDIKLSKTSTEIEGISNIITNTGFDLYNYYVILDDLSKNELKKSGSSVTFKGYDNNNQLVVNEKYTIGHDCCHVLKIAGKEVIIVN